MTGEKVTVGADLDQPIYFEGAVDDDGLLRVHYRIERVTGRAGYVVRHFAAASEEDRTEALEIVDRLNLDCGFRYWSAHDVVRRERWCEDRRRWVEFVDMGTRVEDPLVQLELEMMIDGGVTV